MPRPDAPANLCPTTSALLHGAPVTTDLADGYPLAGLMESFLGASCSDDCGSGRGRRVVDEVVTHWVDILAHDIAQIPEASPPAVTTVRSRMVATQQALMQVRATWGRPYVGKPQPMAEPLDPAREHELQW